MGEGVAVPHTAEMGPRRTLEAAIAGYLDERYPYWQVEPSRVPDNLRVEMHPITRFKILGDPDTAYPPHLSPDVFGKLSIPAKITLELQPGEWRLVQIVVDVKTGGRLK
jgi:hypothetical protein